MTVLSTAGISFLLLDGHNMTAQNAAPAVLVSALAVMLIRQSSRSLALRNPEAFGIRLALPIRVLLVLFEPIAWLTNQPISLLLRAIGVSRHPLARDPGEALLAAIDAQNTQPDHHDDLAEERRMMRGILAMSGQTVREIMS